MPLSEIRFREVEDQWESLALSLQAVIRRAGLEVDYDSLCSALGLSLMTSSTGRDDDCLGWWMAHGRDVRLLEAAALFGLRLRDVHPPDAARDLDRAPEFAQHFEASYRPIVLRALENGQPVIAWRGWPDRSHSMWGVITEPSADGVGLAGATIWSDGRIVPLVAPPVQLYVVEEAAPRRPSGAELLRAAIEATRGVLNNEPDGRWNIVTGLEAYNLWAQRLIADQACPPCGDRAGGCHSRMARFVTYARQSAVRYLQSCRSGSGAPLELLMDSLIVQCRGQLDALGPALDESRTSQLIRTSQGRQTLAANILAAREFEQNITNTVAELDRRLNSAPSVG
ncbi:MAG: hypothetical protein ACYSUI_15230 [Planctomycetota bacterium]